MLTIQEAIQNALDYIETQSGHKNGSVYEDLAEALAYLLERHPRTMAVNLTQPR